MKNEFEIHNQTENKTTDEKKLLILIEKLYNIRSEKNKLSNENEKLTLEVKCLFEKLNVKEIPFSKGTVTLDKSRPLIVDTNKVLKNIFISDLFTLLKAEAVKFDSNEIVGWCNQNNKSIADFMTEGRPIDKIHFYMKDNK